MKLWKHQQYAVDKYSERPFFGLLFQCGLGKTLTAIKIAEKKNKPVLIIAPDALCAQWEEDIRAGAETEWEVLTVTSKKRRAKKFKEALAKFLDL